MLPPPEEEVPPVNELPPPLKPLDEEPPPPLKEKLPPLLLLEPEDPARPVAPVRPCCCWASTRPAQTSAATAARPASHHLVFVLLLFPGMAIPLFAINRSPG